LHCSSRRRHTSSKRDWSSDVCSSDLQRFQGGNSGCVQVIVTGGQKTLEQHVKLFHATPAQPADAGFFTHVRSSSCNRPAQRRARSEERRVGKRDDLGGGRSYENKTVA